MIALIAASAAGCSGTSSPPTGHAKRVFERHYNRVGRCKEIAEDVVRCRVMSFTEDPSVLECTLADHRTSCRGVIPTRREIRRERAHAPRPQSLVHVVSVARLTVPRDIVASGRGFSPPPFALPSAFLERSRLHGRGPSMYLTINRDHYEDDLVTDTGNRARIRVSDASGRLLSDTATTSSETRSWDATTRVLEITRHRAPSYFGGPRDPLGVFQGREDGDMIPAGPRRYVDGRGLWTLNSKEVPVRYQQRDGPYWLDVRFTKIERLRLTPARLRALRIGRHPHSRVVRARS